MSVTLNEIVSSLVETAPTGEINEVKADLLALASDENRATINDALDSQIDQNGLIVSGELIASKLNKDPSSSKYWDYIEKRKFNVDLDSKKAIDIESAEPGVEYPSYFDKLVELLKQYGEDHYPSEYAFSVIPELASSVKIVIIGQKLNKNNFYTGIWKSVYSVDSEGTIEGSVKLDIHYYEEGNVRLEFDEATPTSLIKEVSASAIVNVINKAENEATMKILGDFTLLNQKYFKNLRRLLPVTKLKINWGKAIGAYRLGSDVVNKK
ncbi:subunits of heterodimeric actin filament capping protein Capz [Metschnikowia bicuspidata var. bicuspidata NRRL YB-4993]|uniref:F-actin-capping protein subunit alpha n=1 Tax=Metschnikowia bicuspidata var. bicuspidata NRRL YB-4993 TaxID=869754 RepID=A0A1A0HGB8_9ASCO|nr:subunits of heterodimeric actin filament capping protein Capz [Metschnikowia bicuspidata var. bicuspidata NRRL YB-4993]OBA23209.1 subunits of heterodimeric actin filament capping protein Capz [Metschnikowia bicuspidata var. bicuspidata NRRL YB-4993]